MILQRFSTAIAALVLYCGIGVTAIEKMLTESYRPWRGDSMSALSAVRGARTERIVFVEDSAELQALLFIPHASTTLIVERDLHPAFTPLPVFAVSGGTRCKILDHTDIWCGGGRSLARYARVRITSGSNRRRQGFVCEAQLVRTVAMP